MFVEIASYKYSYRDMDPRLHQIFLAIEKVIALEVGWEMMKGKRKCEII